MYNSVKQDIKSAIQDDIITRQFVYLEKCGRSFFLSWWSLENFTIFAHNNEFIHAAIQTWLWYCDIFKRFYYVFMLRQECRNVLFFVFLSTHPPPSSNNCFIQGNFSNFLSSLVLPRWRGVPFKEVVLVQHKIRKLDLRLVFQNKEDVNSVSISTSQLQEHF